MAERACDDCGNPASPPYTNAVDDSVRCEACAVAEYKAKHPLTWDMPMLLRPGYLASVVEGL